MIMFTFDRIVCVTNRRLCRGDFLTRIREIARVKPKAIILREKDMSEADYERLAEEVMRICRAEHVDCILHSFIEVAARLDAEAIHLPFSAIEKTNVDRRFRSIGVSCHSPEEARIAEAWGASYLIAGHVFATNCKRDLAPRGVDFIRRVTRAVHIPVFAIGGINRDNVGEVFQAGAAAACIMSGFFVDTGGDFT